MVDIGSVIWIFVKEDGFLEKPSSAHLTKCFKYKTKLIGISQNCQANYGIILVTEEMKKTISRSVVHNYEAVTHAIFASGTVNISNQYSDSQMCFINNYEEWLQDHS